MAHERQIPKERLQASLQDTPVISTSNQDAKATAARQGKSARRSPVGGVVVIDAEECKGCGLCVEVCPPGVLQISEALNRMGYHPAEYKGVECTGCGVCFYVCPEPAAITVYKKREVYEQLHGTKVNVPVVKE